jgi:TrpR-related protein YerC/YecD
VDRKSNKNKSFNTLSRKERNEIIYDFIYSIAHFKNVNEAALFLEDLLTESELEFISRRLRIANLLINGKTYQVIRNELHVSESTISKIAVWLSTKGDGFRNVIKSLPSKKISKNDSSHSSWTNVKRKYPAYFLPEILIEEIVNMANKKQKERLFKIVTELDDSLKEKSQLHREIESILKKK